jgi:hypothetical protein
LTATAAVRSTTSTAKDEQQAAAELRRDGRVYFLQGHLVSTAPLTDATGGVVERVQYESLGQSMSSALTHYNFTRRERDTGTGLLGLAWGLANLVPMAAALIVGFGGATGTHDFADGPAMAIYYPLSALQWLLVGMRLAGPLHRRIAKRLNAWAGFCYLNWFCDKNRLSTEMPKSKLGLVIAAGYLLLVLGVCLPLIFDGAIHHGNGIAFLGATVLTSPLSWLAFQVIDSVTGTNAFHLTGGPYFLYMGVLVICTLLNATALYLLVSWFGRLFAPGRGRRDQPP